MSTELAVRSAVESMLSQSPASLDAHGSAAALSGIRCVRAFLDRYEASVTSRVAELHAAGSSAPAADLHTRNGGVSSREARKKERRAETLDQAPAMASALSDGAITAEHADALANAISRVDDDTKSAVFGHDADLARDAGRLTPEQFGRNCRDLVALLERDQGIERAERQRRNTSLSTDIDRAGMYVLTARMHPELGAAVFGAIDAEVAALVKADGNRSAVRARLGAEALGRLVTGGHQAVRPVEAEIRLHVDARTLSEGVRRPGSVCELDDGTPVPPVSAVRLLCNGVVVPIVVDPNGSVLDIGRQHRLANRQQRRALRAMYRTCAFSGCDVHFNRCEIHHLHEWEHGGLTDLRNLLPLCIRHHHLVHEGRWSLELAGDRTLTIRQPDGELFARCLLETGQPAPEPAIDETNRRQRPPPPAGPPEHTSELRDDYLPAQTTLLAS